MIFLLFNEAFRYLFVTSAVKITWKKYPFYLMMLQIINEKLQIIINQTYVVICSIEFTKMVPYCLT